MDIANAEHIPYDAILNKPYEGAYSPDILPEVSPKLEPIRSSAQSLTPSQKAAYNEYLNETISMHEK
jgi:hypothetical protein